MSVPTARSSGVDRYANWPQDRIAEIHANQMNGNVGSVLVSETASCRVWHLSIAPGARLPFHCHVLDYFWTIVSGGSSRSYFESGEIRDATYQLGDTKHFVFERGEHMLHDLENIGEETLVFVTVEMKSGKNEPLALA